MTDIGRRSFLGRMGAVAGLTALAPSLDGLAAYAAEARHARVRPLAGRGRGGYGPLVPAGPELALPEGFRYVKFGVEGEPMSDGTPTPRAHDGMAAFPMPDGDVLLVRNHEVGERPLAVAADDPAAYDAFASGGTTTLRVHIAEDGAPALLGHFRSLSGTHVNCAGGPTPWGSWLTCEETTQGVAAGYARPHGYVFEVPASADARVLRPEPLRAMGRFVHEAVAIDPATGIAYLTEDAWTAGFYRFIPNMAGRYREGGRLQMLGVRGAPHYGTKTGQTAARQLPVVWIDIEDPDPDDAEQHPLAVFAEGYGKGGALFDRLEGCWYGDGAIYFNATSGGGARCGQVWQYRPGTDDDGTLALVFESPGADVLKSPDNITVSPRGGLVLCEDTRGSYVRGLTPDGEIFDFARNILNDREFAGACYSPDGRVLFFNIQGDTRSGGPGHLGMTFGVWGPWERGAL